MICIYCFHTKTAITNSRGHKKEASTWRRHECPNCKRVFSSIERPAMADSYLITDEVAKSEVAYSRTRLSASLLRSFGHLSGTDLYTAIDWLTETSERSLMAAAYDGHLSKDELAMLIHQILKNYDPVAAVQYAAQNGLVGAVKKRPGRPSLR